MSEQYDYNPPNDDEFIVESNDDRPTRQLLSIMRAQIRALFRLDDKRHRENQNAISEHVAITASNKQLLEMILAEVKKTNGRVTKHDDQIDKLESARDVSRGAIWTLIIALPIIGGFVGWMLAQHK